MAFSANPSSSSQTSEINVTPLIDVLLVLLIIFMVIVPITPRGLDSSLPQGNASSPALPPVTVRVLGTDPALPVLYRVDGRNVSAAELQPALRSLFAVRQDRTLFVEADRGLSYQQVAAVVDEGKAAGAVQVALQASGGAE